MAEFKTFLNYGDGVTVRGTPGLFYPADKAKVDTMWDRMLSDTVSGLDMSFGGDVEGYTTRDADGNVAAILTVTELDGIKGTLAEIAARLDELDGLTTVDDLKAELSDMQSRLDGLTADLDAVSEEQLNYVRGIEFDTTAGALTFLDGSGISTFTLGGAAWSTVGE